MIPKKIQNSIWFNILLFLVAVFLSVAAYKSVKQALYFKKETDENKTKISELLKKKNELEIKIEEFQTIETKERSAKERLNLKKPGEEVVVVLPEETQLPKDIEKTDLWSKVRDFFSR